MVNEPAISGLEASWEGLCLMDPNGVSKRAGIRYDDGVYVIRFLNGDYLISPQDRRIIRRFHKEKIGFELSLILVSYLVSAKASLPSGEWVSPEELKGGRFFFRGSHQIETAGLIERFGDDPDGFIEAGYRLGAREAPFGDAGIVLPALPRIPLAYILWKGDEEFSPEIKILFDKTGQEHLALDLLWALVRVVTRKLLFP